MVIWDNRGVLHRAAPYDASLTARHAPHHPARGRAIQMTTARTAIVTGGGSGIGLAISRAAGRRRERRGHLRPRRRRGRGGGRRDRGRRAARPIGLTVDVTDRARHRRRRRRGPASGWAGPPSWSTAPASTDSTRSCPNHPEKWNRILAVNLTGTFDCCQAVVPDMIEEGWGRIVNISSSSAQGGQPIMTHYVASKAGVIGFTKALALELGPKGITVNTIPPGFIDTPMLRGSEEKGLSARGWSTTPRRPRCAGSVSPRTSPPPARSWSARRPATSPARSSASTAGGTPDGAHPAPAAQGVAARDARGAGRAAPGQCPPPPPVQKDRPKALNALGTLAHHPELARAFNTFNGHILFASTLSPRQRELVVLRMATVRASDYEWAQHAVLAGDVGLERGRDRPYRPGPRGARMVHPRPGHARAVDELVGDAKVSDATWLVLAGELDSSSSWTWSSRSGPTRPWPWPSGRSGSSSMTT
jgi:2-hydroxycyclohexanecarboxyl-CoA dehydrogenase